MASIVPLRIISFNIRYAATNRETNEKPWSDRSPLVINLLNNTAQNAARVETVIGLQEVLNSQLMDIKVGLGTDWDYIGVGRDDGKTAGEYNPIFYRPANMLLVFQQTKWLSPTPEKPSYGWHAGSRRMVNVGVFEHVGTKQRLIAANTHLDNASSEARTKGVRVVLRVLKEIQCKYGPLPVFLTGDFNSEPDQDAYNTVVDDGFLADMYTLASPSQRFGDYYTFTGFNPKTEDENKSHIDFIWLGSEVDERWKVTRHEVLSNVENNVYMSDHRAVVGDVLLLD